MLRGTRGSFFKKQTLDKPQNGPHPSPRTSCEISDENHLNPRGQTGCRKPPLSSDHLLTKRSRIPQHPNELGAAIVLTTRQLQNDRLHQGWRIRALSPQRAKTRTPLANCGRIVGIGRGKSTANPKTFHPTKRHHPAAQGWSHTTGAQLLGGHRSVPRRSLNNWSRKRLQIAGLTEPETASRLSPKNSTHP